MSAKPGRQGVVAGSAVVRKLVREFKPGYHLRPGGKAKHAVYGPDGQPVRMPGTGVPLLLASSPSGRAAEHVMRGKLRKAGVLP